MQFIKTQLAVIGGGPAGVTAAIAAARQGLTTALITNRPVLGGNSSSEIRVWTRGATGAGNLMAEEMGIWGELKLENLYRNPDANPVFWDEVLLDAVLREPKLTLWLNTEVFDVTMEGGAVASVQAVQLDTEARLCVQAQIFLDATGDGFLGAKAGIPYDTGNAAGETLGSSILYYTRREAQPVPFIAPDYAYSLEHIEKILGNGGRIIRPEMSGSDCWWFEYGGLRDTIADAQNIALELRRLVMGVWNYVKNSGRFDAGCYTLDWIGSLPGKRESRRMKTEYRLTEADILARREFSDGAFYGGWYVDSHPSGGMYDTQAANCVQMPVDIYQLPLRCLYSRAVPNLLFAGRNIGVERSVFFSSRIMNTCALSGQAAATLAAACLAAQKAPGDLAPSEIAAVQRQLLRDDVFIPGCRVPDSEDLSAGAAVSASSAHSGRPGPETGTLDLSGGGFLTAPVRSGAQLQFEVCADSAGTLEASFALSALPNCLRAEKGTPGLRWQLRPGRQTLTARLPGGDAFAILFFSPTPGVSLCLCRRERVGFLCGRTGHPERLEPRAWCDAPSPYEPAALLPPGNRPWKTSHAWIADGSDPAPRLRLQWNEAVPIRRVELFFDPDLTMELPSSHARHWEPSHLFAPRQGMPPQLVKSFTLTAQLEQGGTVLLASSAGQHQRRVCIPVAEERPIRAICLEIHETWGGLPPVVYRVSAF